MHLEILKNGVIFIVNEHLTENQMLPYSENELKFKRGPYEPELSEEEIRAYLESRKKEISARVDAVLKKYQTLEDEMTPEEKARRERARQQYYYRIRRKKRDFRVGR